MAIPKIVIFFNYLNLIFNFLDLEECRYLTQLAVSICYPQPLNSLPDPFSY